MITDTMARTVDHAPAGVRVDTFKADRASRDLLLPQILATDEALRRIRGFISDQIIERSDEFRSGHRREPGRRGVHQHRSFDPAGFLEHNGIPIERAQFETGPQAGHELKRNRLGGVWEIELPTRRSKG